MTIGRSILRDSVAADRRDLGVASVLLMLHQAGEALVPVLVGVVIDKAVRGGDWTALLTWLSVLGLDFLLLSVCYRMGARRTWLAEARADQRLRLRVTDRVLDARGGAELGHLPGALVNIAVGDAKRVANLHLALPFGLAGLAALVVAGIALLRISLPLGLLILLGTPPLLYLLRLLGKPLQRRSGPEQERAAQAAGVAADLVNGIRVLKGIGAEAAAVRRYTLTSGAALTATLRAGLAQGWYQGAMLAANGLFLALIALVGGRFAAAGSISIGGLVAAVGLAQFLITPMNIFGRVISSLAQARASADRIASVLIAPHAAEGGTEEPASPPRGALRFRQVGRGALTGLDLDVPAGQLLGIVSPDPAVVAALLSCVNREADPEYGSIELDGSPLTTLDPAALRAAILVAAHDAELFAGTLWENVSSAAHGGDPGAALAAAQADEVAGALAAGVHSPISEQGRSLSGGQRQRVALARALAADAPVLVLHDPTTALDTVTEARIAGALREVRAGRTTLVATTSPALLAACDRVVALDGGGVVTADGSHADLLHSRDDYRTLVLA